MNGCTINSKDRCRESGAHGVAKIYYLHKLLYQNIRSFLLNDILVKNILVRNTQRHARNFVVEDKNPAFLHLVGSERFFAIGRRRFFLPFFPLFHSPSLLRSGYLKKLDDVINIHANFRKWIKSKILSKFFGKPVLLMTNKETFVRRSCRLSWKYFSYLSIVKCFFGLKNWNSVRVPSSN